MNLFVPRRVARAALAVLALSCTATPALAQAMRPAHKMFLSNGQAVQVFRIDNQSPGSPIATIQSQEAEGLAIERGRLFVARQSHADVAVYDTKSLQQVATLKDPGQQPNSVAVADDGTVYVGNVASASNGRGSVSVYAGGSTSRTKVLRCSRFGSVTGVAVDRGGDVFVNQNRVSGGSPEVDVFPAGSNACHALSISEFYQAGGLAVDPTTQDLLVADEGYRTIFIVPPPYGSVSGQITLPECIGEQVWDIALDPASSLLYISDPENGADALSYPGGSRVATYYMSSAIGIAIER